MHSKFEKISGSKCLKYTLETGYHCCVQLLKEKLKGTPIFDVETNAETSANGCSDVASDP